MEEVFYYKCSIEEICFHLHLTIYFVASGLALRRCPNAVAIALREDV